MEEASLVLELSLEGLPRESLRESDSAACNTFIFCAVMMTSPELADNLEKSKLM